MNHAWEKFETTGVPSKGMPIMAVEPPAAAGMAPLGRCDIQPPDASDLTPLQTAERLVTWSAAKASLSLDRLAVLGALAGLFIALGGAFFCGVMTETSLTHGPTRLLGGVAFSMGLLLVCIVGAELSTGNCLLAAACAVARLAWRDAARVLAVSYAANAAGALLLVLLMVNAGLLSGEHGRVSAAIADAKMALTFEAAFVRGILCNALVCLAVWLILAGRTIVSKFLGLVLPISAFVALGFEHSIANLYLLPAGLLAGADGSLGQMISNVIAVTLGNLVGGVLVACAFWAAYLRPSRLAKITGNERLSSLCPRL